MLSSIKYVTEWLYLSNLAYIKQINLCFEFKTDELFIVKLKLFTIFSLARKIIYLVQVFKKHTNYSSMYFTHLILFAFNLRKCISRINPINIVPSCKPRCYFFIKAHLGVGTSLKYLSYSGARLQFVKQIKRYVGWNILNASSFLNGASLF